jgi:MFS family permease
MARRRRGIDKFCMKDYCFICAFPSPLYRATALFGPDFAPKEVGVAAWLGWMFDGLDMLDMHLYTLVAAPFVAELLRVALTARDAAVKASVIQAAFLAGWALGGAFFGRIGDLLGRSRTLSLTILTYAAFTGLSFFAHEWWHLLIFRFLAALGVGDEWAVGASLLSETWPTQWRLWIAAGLQTAVNSGFFSQSSRGGCWADFRIGRSFSWGCCRLF